MTAAKERKARGLGVSPNVVVRFRDEAGVPYEDGIQRHAEELRLGPWSRLEERYGPLVLNRMIRAVEPERILELQRRAQESDAEYEARPLTSFFYVDAPLDADLRALAKELSSWPSVERAYVDAPGPAPLVNAADDPRSTDQDYLDAAPQGIDARYAWGFTGGDGEGQRIADLERGWTLDHEDLVDQAVTLLGTILDADRSHGTSVLGELCAVDNTIGCVGIVPNIDEVIATSFNGTTRVDAITAALDQMAFGDVLLIEAQVWANWPTKLLGPIECYDADYEALRLATALGIVVVEAGGNGTDNGSTPPMAMDTWADNAGRQLLDPASTDFRDSGAIIVTAATSATPRTRLAYAPHGERIDCHAWGQNIDTCGSDSGGATTLYRTNFGGTSGASPIVTGAAVAVQGICEASNGFRLSPREMREILSDTGLNTAPAATEATEIGVMPNLRPIIDNQLGTVADVYMRDFVGDVGEPHSGPISASPDIILRQSPVADPQAAFGQGSGTETSSTLGDTAAEGQDHVVYVRVLNQGNVAATDVHADVHWSEVATLVTPDLWNPVGTTIIPSVPTGEQLVCSDAIPWPATEIPGLGHYCFVAILGAPGDPAPAPADFLDWDNFNAFIRNNNNVTWRNFNVVDVPPGPPPGPAALPFLVPGWPKRRLRMRLEVLSKLPRSARVALEAPQAFLQRARVSAGAKIDGETGMGRARVPSTGRRRFADMVFPAGARFRMRLLVDLPDDLDPKAHNYGRVVARQMHGRQELGRVTWLFCPGREVDGGQRSGARR